MVRFRLQNPIVTVMVDSTVFQLRTGGKDKFTCTDNMGIARDVAAAATAALKRKRYDVHPPGFTTVGLGMPGKRDYLVVNGSNDKQTADTCSAPDQDFATRQLIAKALQHAPLADAEAAALGSPLILVSGVQCSRESLDMQALDLVGHILDLMVGEISASTNTSLDFRLAVIDARSGTVLWKREGCFECHVRGTLSGHQRGLADAPCRTRAADPASGSAADVTRQGASMTAFGTGACRVCSESSVAR